MLSSEPSWPPAAEVSVWGQVTVVPLTSGLEASPKLTVTAPSEPVLTEIWARPERSSSALVALVEQSVGRDARLRGLGDLLR